MAENTLNNIKSKIQGILNRKFASDSYIKKQIDVFHDRWAFACPCCHDSLSNPRKKRGNLYLDSMSYHCYNCGAHYGINSFLKRFDEELDGEDKLFVHEIQQSAKKFERTSSNGHSSIAFKLLGFVAVPKPVFFKLNKLTTPSENDFCSNYLKKRCIDINKWKYFAYKESTKELFILNINENDRIIGYQVRQLDDKSKKARYLTTNISRMYMTLFKRELGTILEKLLTTIDKGQVYLNEEDGIENIVANIDRLSGLFNIMNINPSLPITIVEGPIDSLAIDNSIALQGATKMNNYFDNIKNVRYLFDNDKVGKEHSIKKLDEHKSVFLWDKYLKKVNVKQKIKDLNDLQKSGKLDINVFEECFSDDELDIMMI